MADEWPDLATPGWQEAAATLHMWSQIVGKTLLQFQPPVNHWWHITFQVSARGLVTPLIHAPGRAFDVELDLHEHALRVRADDGRQLGFALAPMTVAEFYRRYRALLAELGVDLRILARPVEVVEAIPFERDERHHAYDPAWARALAGALRSADAVLREFRGGFTGKASPVHFFWGGFDLAVTRFSGRPAPRHGGGIPNCADWVMVEAYSHEVSSCGFWPGSADFPQAAFYAYAYPEPDGFAAAPVRPAAAHYDTSWREFMLPYDAVRRAADPRADLLACLESTYA
ncbi:MAG TPA: DUF5996 family protein, partial [Kofleriaceae bacterium]|nr:DUF5996 family protein [Kofleriaceae bacterium]